MITAEDIEKEAQRQSKQIYPYIDNPILCKMTKEEVDIWRDDYVSAFIDGCNFILNQSQPPFNSPTLTI